MSSLANDDVDNNDDDDDDDDDDDIARISIEFFVTIKALLLSLPKKKMRTITLRVKQIIG